MKIVLATLATPTITSELYDFTLGDLADMYDTRAFLTEAEAIAWAEERIEVEYKSYIDSIGPENADEEGYQYVRMEDSQVEIEDVVRKYCYWAQGGLESNLTIGFEKIGFVLYMREQEIG